jgi:hypothetical protein
MLGAGMILEAPRVQLAVPPDGQPPANVLRFELEGLADALEREEPVAFRRLDPRRGLGEELAAGAVGGEQVLLVALEGVA